MSLNYRLPLYIMIIYITEAVTEAIFPDVKSIVRDNGPIYSRITSHKSCGKKAISQIPLGAEWTLCCYYCYQSSHTLKHKGCNRTWVNHTASVVVLCFSSSACRPPSIMPFHFSFIIVTTRFQRSLDTVLQIQLLFFTGLINFFLVFPAAVSFWIDLGFQRINILQQCMCAFTFHDVDQGSHIALLNDAAVFSILHRVHAVHDLLDLRQLQVLHEVIVQDGFLDQILGPADEVKKWDHYSNCRNTVMCNVGAKSNKGGEGERRGQES